MANVLVDENSLQSIANAIREKNGTENTYKPAEMTQAILDIEVSGDEEYQKGYEAGLQQGYEDGKNSVVPLERYAKTIQLTSLNIFGKAEAELNLDNATTLYNLCNVELLENANTTVEHLTINIVGAVSNTQNMLYSQTNCDDTVLKRITLNVNTQSVTNFSNMLGGRRGLEIIDGEPIDFSATASASINPFTRCYALSEFRVVTGSIFKNFNVSSCQNLSIETIQSIIDGLADLTGGDTQTITFHADVGVKLTDEQKATITAKNWTLAY